MLCAVTPWVTVTYPEHGSVKFLFTGQPDHKASQYENWPLYKPQILQAIHRSIYIQDVLYSGIKHEFWSSKLLSDHLQNDDRYSCLMTGFITLCWVSRNFLGQYHVDDYMGTDDFKLHYVGLSLGTQTKHGYFCLINNEKKVFPTCRL